MSGTIGALAALANSTWEAKLRAPASFRGVQFFVRGHGGNTGRRLDIKERPLSDEPLIQDLGRGVRKYVLTGFVLGDFYMADRDALIAAMEDKAVAGTLRHPWLGEMLVWAESCGYKETAEDGGMCVFELGFISAKASSLATKQDPALLALQQVRAVLGTARAVAALVMSQRNFGAFLLAAGASYLSGVAAGFASFVGLPGLNLQGLAGAQDALAVQNPAATTAAAAAIVAPYQAVADAVCATPSGYIASGSTAAQGASVASSRADTGFPAGWAISPLLAAAWAAPETGDTEAAALAAAIADLSADAATCAAIQVALYAAWLDAGAAAEARDKLVGAIELRADAAADAEADDLYLGWLSLRSRVLAAFDATLQALPSRRGYVTGAPLPSLVLAQRLFADATRADELVGANAVPHPAVMPRQGVYWP
jgi:prophage DNA circulation protein